MSVIIQEDGLVGAQNQRGIEKEYRQALLMNGIAQEREKAARVIISLY